MSHKSLLLRGLRSRIMPKPLPRPLVSGAVLVTQWQGENNWPLPKSGLTRAKFPGIPQAVGSSNEVRT